MRFYVFFLILLIAIGAWPLAPGL